jgi:hypothetical protein
MYKTLGPSVHAWQYGSIYLIMRCSALLSGYAIASSDDRLYEFQTIPMQAWGHSVIQLQHTRLQASAYGAQLSQHVCIASVHSICSRCCFSLLHCLYTLRHQNDHKGCLCVHTTARPAAAIINSHYYYPTHTHTHALLYWHTIAQLYT